MRLKKILLFIICAFILNAFTCNKAKKSSNDLDYFDCERYSYFDNKEPIEYSKEDSTEFVHFFLKHELDSAKFIKSYLKKAYTYLNRFKQAKNKTIFLDFIEMTPYVKYSGDLTKGHVAQAIFSDAFFMGKVVQINKLKNNEECYYFKTLIAVQVEQILNTNFPLKKNDIVIIARRDGYDGGCIPGSNTIQYSTHTRHYKIGDEAYFPISRSWYDFRFIKNKNKNKYQDKYCPNVFVAYENFAFTDVNNKKIKKSLIQLFNQNLLP